jgi:hypothetical protein
MGRRRLGGLIALIPGLIFGCEVMFLFDKLARV